jgi:hypothetical protein
MVDAFDAIEVEFEQEKETKGAWRFSEVVEGDLDEPLIRTLYVRKATLKQLGWEQGARLWVTLSVKSRQYPVRSS